MGKTSFVFCALTASLFAIPVFAAVPCHQEFAFRANPMIGLGAIRRLSQLDQVKDAPHTKDGAELVVWQFDEEDHPAFGKYRGVALIFATRNDLGEETPGGLLLQAGSAPALMPSELTVKQVAGGVALELPTRGSCPAFVVKLLDGGTISVQGHPVGHLR